MASKKTPRAPKPGVLDALQAQSDRRWSRGLPIAAMVLSVLSTVAGLLYQASRDREQSRSEKAQRDSTEVKIGGLSSRIEVLSEAVRVLTALAAPQLTKAIDDSLKAAVKSDNPHLTIENVTRAGNDLLSLNAYKIHTDPSVLLTFGNDVTQILQKDDESPDVWSVAATLLTYRSGVQSNFLAASLPNCLSLFQRYQSHPPNSPSKTQDMLLANCELVLDDVEGYWNSPFGKVYKVETQTGETNALRLVLSKVQLTYRGGEMIPFNSLYCDDCTFRFEARAVISGRSKAIMKNLLVSDLNKIEILPPKT